MNKNIGISILIVAAFVFVMFYFIKKTPPIKSDQVDQSLSDFSNPEAVSGEQSFLEGELSFSILREGQGDVTSKTGDTLVVNYIGGFLNGEVFDSNIGQAPFDFNLGAGDVIRGWDLGLIGMKVGEVRRIVVPPEFGYGDTDRGIIPGGSTLIFEVELLEIK